MRSLAAFHCRLVAEGPRGIWQLLLVLGLIPLGWLYGLAGRVRVRLYRRGLLPRYRAPVPVISVGNLAVGGTGKTPVVDYLVRHLLAGGKKVAVVSRGYGGVGVAGVGVVSAGTGALLPPELCGDEPFLLARRNPRSLVFVAPRRAAGVREAVERFGAEVVLLDDGFQHLAVARDLDLVLLDARRPLGNGRVLPAGALREAPAALARADLILLTRSCGDESFSPPAGRPVLRCRHVLADAACSLSGEVVPLASLAGKRGVAFAGIADPAGFFAALIERGVSLAAAVPLPDHAVYDRRTLARLAAAARGADFLVTTEKDGVKLTHTELPVPCYQVPLSLEFFEPGALERALEPLLGKEAR